MKSEKTKIVIIGRPNVGKSSLFNRIVGKRQAIVHEVAGTTRDIVSETVTLPAVISTEVEKSKKRSLDSQELIRDDNIVSFDLFDTAGYLIEKNGPFTKETVAKITEAIGFANSLIFVVDGNVPPTREDEFIADLARKSGKQVILVINKLDNGKPAETKEYLKFGFKDCFPVSVIHNLGVGDLLTGILKRVQPFRVEPSQTTNNERRTTRITIIGRPNVGKSSILNTLVKKERSIVSKIPGTTRDVISEVITLPPVISTEQKRAEKSLKKTSRDSHVEEASAPSPQNDKEERIALKISDTAGARKPGKIGKAALRGEPVEKYSYLRTEKEVENSDIVLVVLDASEKIAAQDLHIAGMAREKGKGIIILVNKWDLAEGITQEKYLARLRHYFSFMIWVPVVFVSAKTGRNITEITGVIKKVSENQRQEIPTSKLNRIIEDFILTNPPKGRGPFKPKVFFASQTDVVPPTFTISAKHHAIVHFSWRRALENELRRHFNFTGTPIKIVFKAK